MTSQASERHLHLWDMLEKWVGGSPDNGAFHQHLSMIMNDYDQLIRQEMETSEKVVKCCPFCGGEAKEWEKFDDGAAYMGSTMAKSYHIGCTRCMASISRHKSASDVREAWNVRLIRGHIPQ